MESENVALKSRVNAFEEECACLPEDWGVEEYVTHLRESIAALEDKCLDMESQKVKAMERLDELREAAAWNIECGTTLYEKPPWPKGWSHKMVHEQRKNRESEFYATCNLAIDTLRALIEND